MTAVAFPGWPKLLGEVPAEDRGKLISGLALVLLSPIVATSMGGRGWEVVIQGISSGPWLDPVFDHTGRANRGHALETVVRVELERRRFDVTYVKTEDGFEVDFLARRPGSEPMLIQLAAELDDPVARGREVRALLAAHEEHPHTSMHLVTLTSEATGGIPSTTNVYPAWQWLPGPFSAVE